VRLATRAFGSFVPIAKVPEQFLNELNDIQKLLKANNSKPKISRPSSEIRNINDNKSKESSGSKYAKVKKKSNKLLFNSQPHSDRPSTGSITLPDQDIETLTIFKRQWRDIDSKFKNETTLDSYNISDKYTTNTIVTSTEIRKSKPHMSTYISNEELLSIVKSAEELLILPQHNDYNDDDDGAAAEDLMNIEDIILDIVGDSLYLNDCHNNSHTNYTVRFIYMYMY
jgi:hypothetical protein